VTDARPTAPPVERDPLARRAARRRARDGLKVVPPGPLQTPDSSRVRRLANALVVLGDVAAMVIAIALVRSFTLAHVAYAAVALISLGASSAYRLRISLSALDEAPRFAIALSVPLLVVAPFVHKPSSVLWQAVASLVAVVLVRAAVYGTIRRGRRHGLTERTLIAGTGHVGIELAHVLATHPEYGLEVVGFVGAPFPNLPGPLLADVAHLDDVITQYGIRRVLVAFGPTRESELVGVLRTAVLRDVDVHVVPRFFEVGVAPRGPDVDDLWGIPVYRVRQAALRAGAWRFKRALDVTVASVMLIVTSPIMAAAAVLVKLSGPGPILFRQRRIGQHGTEFEVLKFRTLPVNYSSGSAWNAWDVEYSNPIGRWLRRLSIDELPQLWNILRGDMSLVGPRPELGHFVEQFSQSVYGYGDRHRLPVGLTGWAQIHGLRGATSLRERARFDNQYIEHWSLWRDIVILIRTGGAFFRQPHPAAPPEPVLRTASGPAGEEQGEALDGSPV
jgi:exopolysaccharide biosynthesis polyprenyl glycosylphosphotransferase